MGVNDMPDIKETLIDLLTGYSLDTYEDVQYVADELIAKGVLPVVRCKDCKHWKKGQFMGGNSIDDLEYGGSCPLARFARYESDFCSYGERKAVTE
jgi:hypothetical protein